MRREERKVTIEMGQCSCALLLDVVIAMPAAVGDKTCFDDLMSIFTSKSTYNTERFIMLRTQE